MCITDWLCELLTVNFGGTEKRLKVIISCRQYIGVYLRYTQQPAQLLKNVIGRPRFGINFHFGFCLNRVPVPLSSFYA